MNGLRVHSHRCQMALMFVVQVWAFDVSSPFQSIIQGTLICSVFEEEECCNVFPCCYVWFFRTLQGSNDFMRCAWRFFFPSAAMSSPNNFWLHTVRTCTESHAEFGCWQPVLAWPFSQMPWKGTWQRHGFKPDSFVLSHGLPIVTSFGRNVLQRDVTM